MVSSSKKPVVGVIGNSGVINDRHNVQLVGQRNMRAVADVAGALSFEARAAPGGPREPACVHWPPPRPLP